MASHNNTQSWLVAAWPGMGNVAVIAAGHLVQKKGFQPVGEMPTGEHFDLQGVDVMNGVIAATRLPRSVFYQPPTPQAKGPRLTVFLAEAQPSQAAFAYARAVIERAQEWGVDRVVTFASMASQLHPTQQPRVYGAATTPAVVDELRRLEVAPLEAGQIGGMNGLLLGAAAERGIPGVCLMGEIPFFAAAVGNPKAGRAVLEAFAFMAGFEVDLDELSRHAEVVDKALVNLLERLQAASSGEGPDEDEAFPTAAPEAESEKSREKPRPRLDDLQIRHIEEMFEEASKNRARAMMLKQELDRLGVFKEYENRFLDLFRRAE